MPQKLHIDIETFSSVDIRTSGAYKYCESVDFEILMVAYAFDDGYINMIDLTCGWVLPQIFIEALQNPNIEKHAHNANFERNAFRAMGYDIPINQWRCSAVKASYCGLPLSLGDISDALQLEEKGKLSTGRALIKYFCVPIKPSKNNPEWARNYPEDDPEKWREFKEYCINDVEAEREINRILHNYSIPQFESRGYILDQKINDVGILIDMDMARKAKYLDDQHAHTIGEKLKKITGLDNPNSPKQLKGWLSLEMHKKEIKSLSKDIIPDLINETSSEIVKEVLTLRIKSAKTSTKKYVAMLNCACYDDRAHGVFQYYGAGRTGRWAGRLVQLQNLPRNYMKNIDIVRERFKTETYESLNNSFPDVANHLSELIRTTFVAGENKTFCVADYSAIEARVTAYLSGEQWRLDVFNGDGKIYEASASMMFGVPIEDVTKDSDYRYKGKIAELALGYQGGYKALERMGGESMGLSVPEMKEIVRKWRLTSPKICKFWDDCERSAKKAFLTGMTIYIPYANLAFSYDGLCLEITLPSGRSLSYFQPSMGENSWGSPCLRYMGMDQTIRKWVNIDTYGGKLVENIVQAVSRDILLYSMLRLDEEGFKIVMHVHDETICESLESEKQETLDRMCEIMGEEIPWAKGLPLNADGYMTPFYKKD